ncbi:MAG: dihydrolipoyl dehydrogenase [Elusimicrobia bacterium]|nr:dihydrolipoyl dehydrogenase [Elusimicrobiota bacterium]
MRYDAVIIGGGPAGYKAAEKLVSLGRTACIVEAGEDNIGGACLNEGCIPVKSFLRAADLYEKIKMSEEFGIDSEFKSPDFEKIRNSVRANIENIKSGLVSMLRSKGVSFEFGSAYFEEPGKIALDGGKNGKKEIEASDIVIATGSRPAVLSFLEPDGERILTSTQFIKSDMSGDEILIIGGGYIGCEIATFAGKLGKKVTVIEISPQLIPGEDGDIARALKRELSGIGVEVVLDTGAERCLVSGDKVETVINGNRRSFDKVLVAAGRIPDIEKLNLANIGVKTDEGFIMVDRNMKTGVDGIYAAGDVIDTPMLAHTAFREGVIAAEAIAGRKGPGIDYNIVPRVIFTAPEIGAVGLTEESARKLGFEINVHKRHFKANSRAIIMKQDSGFVKVIVNSRTGAVLGASVIGPYASEMIHLFSSAVRSGSALSELTSIIYAHPTFSEMITDMFL